MPPRRAEDAKIYNRIAVLRAERALSRQQLADVLEINYPNHPGVEEVKHTRVN